MAKRATLYTESEDAVEAIEDLVSRKTKKGDGQTWIVDVEEVEAADETKSGNVRLHFKDGKVEIEDAELVGFF